MVLRILNTILMLLNGVLLARLLGPEQYGIYVFVLSVVALLGIPTQEGLPTLIVREVAKEYQSNNWRNLKGLLMLSNYFVIVYSTLTIIVSAITAWNIWNPTDIKAISFFWALSLLPLVAFGNARGATLRGFHKVVQGNLPEQLIRPLVTVSLLAVSMLVGLEVSSALAVQYTLLGAFIAFLAGAILLIINMPKGLKFNKPSYKLKEWSKSLVPLILWSSIDILNSQVAIILLGLLSSEENVALFKIGYQTASFVAIGLLVVNPVIAPHIVRMYNNSEIKILQKLLVTTSILVTLAAVPIFLIFIFFGHTLLGFVFGDIYTAAYNTLLFISIAQLINVMLGSGGLILNMTDNAKSTLNGSFISAFINILLCFLLIPLFGLNGAVFAVVVSIIIRNIIWSISIYRRTGMNSTCFYLKVFAK